MFEGLRLGPYDEENRRRLVTSNMLRGCVRASEEDVRRGVEPPGVQVDLFSDDGMTTTITFPDTFPFIDRSRVTLADPGLILYFIARAYSEMKRADAQ